MHIITVPVREYKSSKKMKFQQFCDFTDKISKQSYTSVSQCLPYIVHDITDLFLQSDVCLSVSMLSVKTSAVKHLLSAN